MLFVGAARVAVGLRCCSAPWEAQGAPGAKKGPSCGMWHRDNPDSPSVVMGWCQFPFLLKDKITSRLSFPKTTQPRNAVGLVQLWGPAPTVFLLFFHCFPTAPSAPTGCCSHFSTAPSSPSAPTPGRCQWKAWQGGALQVFPPLRGKLKAEICVCIYFSLKKKILKKKREKDT